jgi:hypothetical protein
MESFVHLRKGATPRRLHADLDGLKDDELGRGGFTGRTANFFRRHDPTDFRASGPLSPVDVLAEALTHLGRWAELVDIRRRQLDDAGTPAEHARRAGSRGRLRGIECVAAAARGLAHIYTMSG